MQNAIQSVQAEIYRQDILKNGVLEITVIGNSMYPFLKSNDRVVVQSAKTEDISIGDIVLTYNGSRMLCHRVFKKNKNNFQTKADALIRPDLTVTEDALIGKIIAQKGVKNSLRLNTRAANKIGFFISKVMIIGAYLYIPVRLLRRIWRIGSAFLSGHR